MRIQRLTNKQIIDTFNQYIELSAKLKKDTTNLSRYKVLYGDYEDENTLKMKKQIEIDKEEIQRFLDMEV